VGQLPRRHAQGVVVSSPYDHSHRAKLRQISRSSNVDWQNSVELTAKLVLAANLLLADVLFSGKT